MNQQLVFAISPNYTTLDFPGELTLENKIAIFVDRIDGWQLGIEKKILQHEIQHSGFALLHIVFSYFELIGKYLSRYLGGCASRSNFKKGVRLTFPEIEADEEKFLNVLYQNVRNGLYHLGMTKINVALRCDIPGSISFNSERSLLMTINKYAVIVNTVYF